MAAVALIVFDQTGPGPAGEAITGTVADGAVLVTNDDNTDVSSWTITLLDAPASSALVAGTVLGTAATNTPSANFTPDVVGSYRIQLEVSDGTFTNTDIRVFAIPNSRGYIVPPYQKNPDPLPLQGSGLPGAKPEEMNFGGQARGWTGESGDGLLDEFLQTYDDLPRRYITTTPVTLDGVTDPPLIWIDTSAIGGVATVNLPTNGLRDNMRIRFFSRPSGTFDAIVDAPFGFTINGSLGDWTLKPGMSAELALDSTALDWSVIDASLDRYERSVVASAESTDQLGFVAIGATAIDPADYPNLSNVIWQALIETSNAADAAEIRLFNVTTASVVASTTLSTTSLTPVLVQFSGVTLATGVNIYEAQLRLTTTGAPNRATCKQAQLILEWFQ